MILSPLQNTAVFTSLWIQKRPHITQKFGERPSVYRMFNLDGHNGLDLRCKVGTPLFAPIGGKVKIGNSPSGYGLYIKIRGGTKQIVLAHLSDVLVKDGDYVHAGDKIAESGNTGFSSGPHLHLGMKELIRGQEDIFDWKVKNRDNGFNGAIDMRPYVITWKGGLILNNF